MPKKCPPNTFCIENYTLVFILVLVGIIVYFMLMVKSTSLSSLEIPFIMRKDGGDLFQHYHNNLPPHLHDINTHHRMFNVSSDSVRTTSYDMMRPLADPRISFNQDPKDTLLNPYAPPVQVNQPHAYRQIGYLKNESMGHQMFPIFAKPQHLRRDRWYYYTIYNNIKLPIFSNGRKCSSEHGCDSLYNGDIVQLENIPGNFVVSTYDNETLVYEPVI
jgi:hypothetical protein